MEANVLVRALPKNLSNSYIDGRSNTEIDNEWKLEPKDSTKIICPMFYNMPTLQNHKTSI